MPAGIHPIAPSAVRRVSIALALLNAGRDGSGTITALITAGANGTVVPSVRARSQVAVGASAAQVLRLWHQPLGTGTWYMLDEAVLAGTTSSSTAVGASAVFSLTNIALAATDKLGVTQTVSESVAYSADAGDY